MRADRPFPSLASVQGAAATHASAAPAYGACRGAPAGLHRNDMPSARLLLGWKLISMASII